MIVFYYGHIPIFGWGFADGLAWNCYETDCVWIVPGTVV